MEIPIVDYCYWRSLKIIIVTNLEAYYWIQIPWSMALASHIHKHTHIHSSHCISMHFAELDNLALIIIRLDLIKSNSSKNLTYRQHEA